MGHPMHLHGHKFWVLGSGDGGFPYASVVDAPAALINTVNPPYRDTTDLPASGWVAIRYMQLFSVYVDNAANSKLVT